MREGGYFVTDSMEYSTIVDSEIELRVKREVARTFDGQQELMERAQAFLFEALAADASWIRLYINAEELDIPMKEPGKIDSDLEPGIRSVLEVRTEVASPFLSESAVPESKETGHRGR